MSLAFTVIMASACFIAGFLAGSTMGGRAQQEEAWRVAKLSERIRLQQVRNGEEIEALQNALKRTKEILDARFPEAAKQVSPWLH